MEERLNLTHTDSLTQIQSVQKKKKNNNKTHSEEEEEEEEDNNFLVST
jgi:hypothetical protein